MPTIIFSMFRVEEYTNNFPFFFSVDLQVIFNTRKKLISLYQ